MKTTAKMDKEQKRAVTSEGMEKCRSNNKGIREEELSKNEAGDILYFSYCQQIPGIDQK